MQATPNNKKEAKYNNKQERIYKQSSTCSTLRVKRRSAKRFDPSAIFRTPVKNLVVQRSRKCILVIDVAFLVKSKRFMVTFCATCNHSITAPLVASFCHSCNASFSFDPRALLKPTFTFILQRILISQDHFTLCQDLLIVNSSNVVSFKYNIVTLPIKSGDDVTKHVRGWHSW